MLEYENQMFLDVLHQDGLVVSAKGIGMESVILNLLKVYSDPGNLVIVLGTTGKEEEFYISRLESERVKTLPKVITNEYSSTDREIVYLEGGVLFVTPRILVVDLLKDRVPIEHVTGFIVCRAHCILDSCQEAFALRLFRQKNKTGFIKAFSNSAESFTVGFAYVERIMKTLFVKNLYLWPRFHATAQSSLQKIKPVVIELHLELTPAMLQIQTALLDLMNFVIKEMKRCNPTLDMDELTVENALSKSFGKILQLQLDPIWHQLSSNTKQLVADLRTLSHMLKILTRYDCVTFYNQLNSLRTTDYIHKNSGWMVLDSAETLFVVAKQRMLGKSKIDLKTIESIDVDPEANPKWTIVTEVLKEINIKAKVKKEDVNSVPDRVLILVDDNRICEQLKQYLTLGATDMLLSLYKKTFKLREVRSSNKSKEMLDEDVDDPASVVEPQVKEEEADESFKDSYTLSQRPVSEDKGEVSDIKMEVMDTDVFEAEKSLAEESFEAPVVVIQTFKKQGDPLALLKTLKELQPKYVIMYDVDMTTVRRLEVYQAEHPEIELHVYFMIYGGSVEEQAYLTTLRKEKEAFEYLIKEKATMVVSEDQDGRTGDCPELSRDASKPSAVVNTRRGGVEESCTTSTAPVIIVDMREFRSELPSLIHKRGIEIEPVTLQIGDYILTPEICVERKSISDLIGSLNSGRLYNQALSMTRHYSKPMLLIEFDQNKPFTLQGHYYVSNDMSSHDVVAKLQLLTLHFPKLKLVWSPSPYATAQLFEELKQGRTQPNAAQAAAIGADLEGELDDVDKYNSAVHDFVLKLPGITSKNIRSVLNKGHSLDHLIGLTQEKLGELVNNSVEAQSLYSALQESHHNKDEGNITTRNWKGKGRGRFFKKRKL